MPRYPYFSSPAPFPRLRISQKAAKQPTAFLLCWLLFRPHPRSLGRTMQNGKLGVYSIMQDVDPGSTRRHFLRSVSLTAGFFAVPGAFAEELLRKTPWGTQGPLYPDKLPLDTDNDLIIVNDSVTPAVGQITHLSGASSTLQAIRFRTPSSRSGRWTAPPPISRSAAIRRPAASTKISRVLAAF